MRDGKIFAHRIDSHGKAVEQVGIELRRQDDTMWLYVDGERVNKAYVFPVAQLEDALVFADNDYNARKRQ